MSKDSLALMDTYINSRYGICQYFFIEFLQKDAILLSAVKN